MDRKTFNARLAADRLEDPGRKTILEGITEYGSYFTALDLTPVGRYVIYLANTKPADQTINCTTIDEPNSTVFWNEYPTSEGPPKGTIRISTDELPPRLIKELSTSERIGDEYYKQYRQLRPIENTEPI